MCGIAGSNIPRKLELFDFYVNSVTSKLNRRGPDSSGVFRDAISDLALIHTRLSVLDLSPLGSQPMTSSSGRFVITFNGEIYNHREIRTSLAGCVESWRSNSDTETLLQLIEIKGIEQALKTIEGMFAFAIYDRVANKLMLARDRFGEKPLYYFCSEEAKHISFASTLDALLTDLPVDKEINKLSLKSFVRCGYINGNKSIYNGIKKVPPGCYVAYDFASGRSDTFRYYDHLLKYNQPINHSLNHENLISLLKSVISDQMLSDVPIGAFLSGGIDSSLVVSIMQDVSTNPINTFTIGFKEKSFDESDYAKQISSILGTNHTELIIDSNDLLSVIPNIAHIYDEPFADASQIPTFIVSKLAKENVTVALSGDGGDELFCGYNRYFYSDNFCRSLLFNLPISVRKIVAKTIQSTDINRLDSALGILKKVLPKKYSSIVTADRINKIASLIKAESETAFYASLINADYLPSGIINDEPAEHTIAEYINLSRDFDSTIEWMMYVDTMTYMPNDILVKVDRAAMYNSLETRAPFLNHRVYEFARQLPLSSLKNSHGGKLILKDALSKFIPRSLIDRPKMGFGVPIREWLRGPLKDLAFDTLSTTNLRQHGLFNDKLILRLLDDHITGKRNWDAVLWNIINFQFWYDAKK